LVPPCLFLTHPLPFLSTRKDSHLKTNFWHRMKWVYEFEMEVYNFKMNEIRKDGALPFDETRARELLFSIAAGKSIEEALIVAKISFIDMCYWRLNSPSFDKAFSKVRQITAEVFLDKLVEFSNEIDSLEPDKDEIKKAELKFKTLTWLIERLNPEAFAPKARIENKIGLGFNGSSVMQPQITLKDAIDPKVAIIKNHQTTT
jgi:hypothetical protein